jgi:hypothetical protein
MTRYTPVLLSSSTVSAASPRVVPQKRCRHCQETLAKAANNARNRFCCSKCESSFYRVHCRVCERPIEAKNARRQLCGRRKCKAEFRRHQERFFGSRYRHMALSPKRDKTLAKSKGFLPENGGRSWTQRAGPIVSESAFHCATLPLDPELVAHYARARKAAIAERDRRHPVPAPLIGPHDPPINVVGGYLFPNAPKIDLSPISVIATPEVEVAS